MEGELCREMPCIPWNAGGCCFLPCLSVFLSVCLSCNGMRGKGGGLGVGWERTTRVFSKTQFLARLSTPHRAGRCGRNKGARNLAGNWASFAVLEGSQQAGG